ncbi:MAG: hypothetical protein AB1Z22_11365 [Synechococcaceae cyanobacterium]
MVRSDVSKPSPPSAHVLATASQGLLQWFAEALSYAMGNPSEPQVAPPPLLGVQPYRDSPRGRRR